MVCPPRHFWMLFGATWLSKRTQNKTKTKIYYRVANIIFNEILPKLFRQFVLKQLFRWQIQRFSENHPLAGNFNKSDWTPLIIPGV